MTGRGKGLLTGPMRISWPVRFSKPVGRAEETALPEVWWGSWQGLSTHGPGHQAKCSGGSQPSECNPERSCR
jgi:hypothetical protein